MCVSGHTIFNRSMSAAAAYEFLSSLVHFVWIKNSVDCGHDRATKQWPTQEYCRSSGAWTLPITTLAWVNVLFSSVKKEWNVVWLLQMSSTKWWNTRNQLGGRYCLHSFCLDRADCVAEQSSLQHQCNRNEFELFSALHNQVTMPFSSFSHCSLSLIVRMHCMPNATDCRGWKHQAQRRRNERTQQSQTLDLSCSYLYLLTSPIYITLRNSVL